MRIPVSHCTEFQCDFCKQSEQEVQLRTFYFGGIIYDICADCSAKISIYVAQNLDEIREKIKHLSKTPDEKTTITDDYYPKAGDIVRLKSGGPLMTVHSYCGCGQRKCACGHPTHTWECIWYDNQNQFYVAYFDESLLCLVRKTEYKYPLGKIENY